MNRFLTRLRRQSGTTLTEVTISSALLIGMLAFGVPVFKSIGDAGDEGASRLTAQASNQAALLKLGGELQNTSTTATDALGNPRLVFVVGAAPQPLRDQRDGQLSFGGHMGNLGAYSTGSTAPTSSTSGSLVEDDGSTAQSNTNYATGSGNYSLTHHGRKRQITRGAAAEFGSVALRPRQKSIPLNSDLVFQKVVGYAVASDGTPQVNWGPPITYGIRNRKLVRIQSGETRVVASFAVAFRAELTDAGTVVCTLVSQKRVNSTGKITYQSNQIEISPKN